uniref:Uncharacterized protein n=1 Tax=Magallana gigas TaxID=29159 RepID=A0A8W8MSW9_MAGGI
MLLSFQKSPIPWSVKFYAFNGYKPAAGHRVICWCLCVNFAWPGNLKSCDCKAIYTPSRILGVLFQKSNKNQETFVETGEGDLLSFLMI